MTQDIQEIPHPVADTGGAAHGNDSSNASQRSMGDILLATGRLQQPDLERILQRQREAGVAFGQAALALNLLSQADIDFALNKQFDYAYLSETDASLRPELVAAFERLAPRFPHARLVVIGAQPDISHPQIDVLGPIPLDEIGARLAGASIFCMPSRLEPAGIAPLEAAAAGLPVVVTATGGLPQTVEDGTTGYLLPVGDVEGLEAGP